MAYDSQRGRTVMFGGTNNGVVSGDTWEWDGAAWFPQIFASGPAARFFHAMAYDSQRGRSVVFGGTNNGVWFGDTWEWNGLAWTLRSTIGPAPRSEHAMAYDSQRGRAVLFGGYGTGTALGDTWEWNGLIWTQVAATGPAPRSRHAMAYDGQRGRTVLFGGGGHLGDTWEWDGGNWTLVAANGPAPRELHAMAYESQRARTVLFGGFDAYTLLGDTWEWYGITWTQAASTGPSGRYLASLAYDSQSARTLMFGGVSGTIYSSNTQSDTWEWNGYHTGTASTFGAGCGTPTLVLSPAANARPTINTTAQVSLTNVPSSFAFVALGWSRTTFGAFGLPLTLAGYGMPGCDLLQSSEFNVPTVMTGLGTATYSLPLPNWSGLIGLHLYLQGWAVAPGVNPGQTIVSNGVEWAIGDS